MSDTTVKQLATLVGITTEQLLSQMAGAGIDKSSSDDVVTDNEKQKLLAHIRSGQARVSAEPAKVTLRRKSTSTIKAGAGAVNVEVRKKRTYVHRDLTVEAEKQREIDEVKSREVALLKMILTLNTICNFLLYISLCFYHSYYVCILQKKTMKYLLNYKRHSLREKCIR